MNESQTDFRTPPGPISPWSRASWLLVGASFLIGFVNYPLQVLGTNLDYLPGDVIDNRLNNFVLEHGFRWVTGKAESFWDAPSYYPRRGATAWSDAHIGMLPCYVTMRLAGLSPEGAFQGHFALAVVLNFVAAVWALRRLGFGPAGVAAAAYLFAFSLPVVSQTQHTQLIPRFLIPIAVVFAWEFLQFPRTWRLAVVAACIAGQIYIAVYLGYFLVLMLSVGLLVALVRFPHHVAWRELLLPGWRVGVARLAVFTVAILAVHPLIDRHKQASGGGRPIGEIKESAPIPESWLSLPKNAFLHPDCKWSPIPEVDVPEGEHLMFPGFVPVAAVLVVALLAFLPAGRGTQRSLAITAAWSALLLAALVTRIGDIWLYESLGKVPGAGGIRVPGRVCLVLPLLSGSTVAFVIDVAVGYASRFGRGYSVLAGVLCFVAVAAEQRLIPAECNEQAWYDFHSPVAQVLARQERIAEAVRRHPEPIFVYVFPSVANRSDNLRPELRELALQVEVMRATQELGIPCVNGWTGHGPAEWFCFRNYRELTTWMVSANKLPPERLHGLVVIGEPAAAHKEDTGFEVFMRNTFPPQLVQDSGTLP